jgi:AraC-like DNA-binding protein
LKIVQPVNATSPRHGSTSQQPSKTDLSRLADLLHAYAPYDGRHELRLPGVQAVRASRMNQELFHIVYQPSLCIVAQGSKRVLLGADVYAYDELRMLVCSVDLPVASQVTRASHAEPFLCLRLNLDPHKLAELALKVYPHGLPAVRENRGMHVGQADASIVNAATRLLELMADARDVELLAPLVVDEILLRLLRTPIGSRVAQLGLVESNVHRIARAVNWVRDNFDKPMSVEMLAEMVHMSSSSFHQHFKTVTSMSPLQFQKVLRLQEARRLMLASRIDATTASLHVGYLSASQFSREYSRLFGSAPSKDIATLREQDQLLPSAD